MDVKLDEQEFMDFMVSDLGLSKVERWPQASNHILEDSGLRGSLWTFGRKSVDTLWQIKVNRRLFVPN